MNMNDRIDATKTAASCAQSHKPAWWTDSLETSWGKVNAEIVADWGKLVRGEKRFEQRFDTEALALGYGARQVYHDVQVWGDKLEALLKADWKETGHDAECVWTKVRAAVKHGWERAGGVRPTAGITTPTPAVAVTKSAGSAH
jgi:hypothetical protein